MVAAFFRSVRAAFTDPALRFKLFFVLAAFLAFRFLAAIPIPGVDEVRLAQFFADNQFLNLLNIFSGGGFSALSIVLLGVGPYITASIIMQLGTVILPQIKKMYSEEGEMGRTKFISISRVLTIPLAFLQAVAFLTLLENQGIISTLTAFEFTTNVFVVAAGSILLMWIGELITEFGIGNGVSLIIFAGIVASLPGALSQILFTATVANIPAYLAFVVLAIALIYAIVLVAEAERPIPIAHTGQSRGRGLGGATSALPVRLLQAGVMPIVFALSIILLPPMVFAGLMAIGFPGGAAASAWFAEFSANHFGYNLVYFILVVAFTYFYTSITYEPKKVAENLQKTGAFVPGVRPGSETETFIARVVNRITFPAAVFLGFVAVVPFIIEDLTGITAILVGGTAVLIAVNVLIDFIRKVNAQLSLREY